MYAIPRTELLDAFFLTVTKVAGSYGQLWVVVGLVLLIPKKTRWTDDTEKPDIKAAPLSG